ncbi:fibronectin type III domain-containing protein [Kriegella aquimaris]|uniref:Fibronectin type-III domain-containing protein n=1 Tax=Kriegella aquimaris TaxID=192904 RepID=A0A1G9TNH3_9FLAO|nr:fibronectin type III domain-containing protein [Kriegella aquimaris]SDM49326.1 hypothetical protein SAMN04488514_109140 [Kriegella aquimaris]
MFLSKCKSLVLTIFIVITGNLFAQNTNQQLVFSSGKTVIALEDNLHHPVYWWPNTLLNYPIVFNEDIQIEELVLIDELTGKQQPFQLTELQKIPNGITKAILHFKSDLPSGKKKIFALKKGIPERFPHVVVEKSGKEIRLRSDKLTVWIPSSQTGSSDYNPGPVLGIAQDVNKRMGQSHFNSGEKKLAAITSEVTSQGPLFADISVNYRFTDGAIYHAEIRCIKGYDFIEIKEEMSGFLNEEKCSWKIDWSGFSPTHRQAPNHPHFGTRPFKTATDEPGFGRFSWEKIDQSMLAGHLGVIYSKDSTKIPYEISTYGNYPAEKNVTSSVFWDEKSKQSIGIFMNNALGWNDLEYPIWHITGKLNISFYNSDEHFSWNYPVINGKRSTALSCYNHQKDIDYMNNLEKKFQPQQHPSGFTYRVQMSQLSHNSFLQNMYGAISLDKIKDWNLTYPDSLPLAPVIFKSGKIKSIKELEQGFLYSGFVLELPISGTCQNSGYGPTNNREFYGAWVDAFNRLLPKMSAKDRQRFAAMFLFHCYVAADEGYMPMRNMLSGHPNFLADVKSTPAMASFLFPKHPQAKIWEEMFAKYIELNTHYHTRPNVKSWGATGGRWTENLGTYVWAFLKPSLRANYLLQNKFDGANHLANANTAVLGSWLLNSLSSPYDGESLDFYKEDNGRLSNHHWGIVTKEKAPRRIHPPQGAHAARRMPSASLWLLGRDLQYYDPLLSENIKYVANPNDMQAEVLDSSKDPFGLMYTEKEHNPGTPPDFKSEKFTGYGIILRAAHGTKNELSIHLQQIDSGPNYRWGVAADGGCGNIYFYAAGKSYSHNGKEDSGDRRIQDTDLITNFGVFKEGKFKSIGMSVLDSPMYDLGIGQFAEIRSSEGNPYSWPEYQGRSIMLLGDDYFILYDDVHDNNIPGRLSWFTHPDEELPEIEIIKAGGRGSYSNNGKVNKTELFGKESEGVWYDGTGDFLTFVSHKKGFKVEPTFYGGIITRREGSKDYIFRNDLPVKIDEAGMVFSGTAGFIRDKEPGVQEWALFHGTEIGNDKFSVSTTNQDAGISLVFSNEQNISGNYSSLKNSEVTFKWHHRSRPKNIRFYLDGVKHPVKVGDNEMTVIIPAGIHIWNLTLGMPDLSRPEINYTNNEKGKVSFDVRPVAGATSYRFEYSTDVGENWTTFNRKSKPQIVIEPLGNEAKGYVRIIALNKERESQPSVIYPVYFTIEKPHYPDGLKLDIQDENINLTWGKVLGCNEYKLYRRKKGSKKFQLIYVGNKNQFTDVHLSGNSIFEYAITAVNGNGESEMSNVVNNDPSSWLNFNPMPNEPFRRSVNLYDGSRDNSGSPVDLYYPE